MLYNPIHHISRTQVGKKLNKSYHQILKLEQTFSNFPKPIEFPTNANNKVQYAYHRNEIAEFIKTITPKYIHEKHRRKTKELKGCQLCKKNDFSYPDPSTLNRFLAREKGPAPIISIIKQCNNCGAIQ